MPIMDLKSSQTPSVLHRKQVRAAKRLLIVVDLKILKQYVKVGLLLEGDFTFGIFRNSQKHHWADAGQGEHHQDFHTPDGDAPA
jgi:hypothetical protein